MSTTLSRQGLRLDTKAPAALSGDRAARPFTASAATEPPDTAAATTTAELRRVFDAPRGRRFARPGARTAAQSASQSDRTGVRPAASRLASRPASQPGYRPSGSSANPTATAPEAQSPQAARRGHIPLVCLGRTPRERALLAQMPDDPRVRRRLIHGELPAWMDNVTFEAEPVEPPDLRPRKAPAPGPGDGPPSEPARIPRPRREQKPTPPLPRRSGRRRSDWPPRPASHRKPRKRRTGLTLAGYVLASAFGALGHHLYGLL